MKFIEIDSRAIKLSKEHHEIKFYEMVLCFAAEELYEADTDGEDIPMTEEQFKQLLNCMACYLDSDFHESPWHVADALINLVRKHGVEKVIADCDDEGKLLAKELEENF